MKKTEKQKGFIACICKKCKNMFGLDANVIEKFSDVNMRYSCPYCSQENNVK